MKLPIVGILSGIALATLGISGAAQAAILLPSLNPGDQYRLVFVTSGARNATATNILDYNIFVNNAAHASSALNTALTTAGFTPSAISWTAIASTATTSAIVNTATQATDTSRSIYRLDGTQVATSYADLWDSTILAALNVNEQGTAESSTVWTGTDYQGQSWGNSALGPMPGINAIAGSNVAGLGASWVAWDALPPSNLFAMYGISDPLTVPTPAAATTPEPSSLLGLITLGGLMLGGAVRKAKK